MADIIDIVLPVFGILALGYAIAWTGFIRDSETDGLSAYVYKIAVPILVFRFINSATVPETSPVGLLLCYFGAVAIVWAAGSLITWKFLGRSGEISAIAGVGAAYSNTVLLGLPLIVTSYGDAGALIFFIIFPFHMPIVALANAIQIEVSRSGDADFRSTAMATLRGMATNAILVALIAGIAFRLAGLNLPSIADEISETLAATAIPCALFAMGLTLRRYGVIEGLKPALVMTALKLIVMPALVWFLAAHVAGLDPITVNVLTIFAAAPCGINTFIFATRFGTGVAEASSAIAISTGLSILTITVILALLGVD